MTKEELLYELELQVKNLGFAEDCYDYLDVIASAQPDYAMLWARAHDDYSAADLKELLSEQDLYEVVANNNALYEEVLENAVGNADADELAPLIKLCRFDDLIYEKGFDDVMDQLKLQDIANYLMEKGYKVWKD